VFQCTSIAEHIGRTEDFCKYYNENRKVQQRGLGRCSTVHRRVLPWRRAGLPCGGRPADMVTERRVRTKLHARVGVMDIPSPPSPLTPPLPFPPYAPQLQADLDLDPSNAFRDQPFHEFYARYLAQLLGFFIVEDAIFKGLPVLMQASDVCPWGLCCAL